MKAILKNLLLLTVVATTVISCGKDVERTVLKPGGDNQLTITSATLVLLQANAANVATVFGWGKADFRKNGREGIEVSSFGGQGTIGFKRAKISDNGRYGVARLGKTVKGMGMFGNLSFGIGINGSVLDGNTLGNLSPVIPVK